MNPFIGAEEAAFIRRSGLHAFLENASQQIQRTSLLIGKVLIDARKDAQVEEPDSDGVKEELTRLLQEQFPKADANWVQGVDVAIAERYPLLKKYINAITLHREERIGPYVQVMPFAT